MDALVLLDEPPDLPSFDLPPDLRRLYPGTVGFADDCLYVNFVSTIDGVVALPALQRSNTLIADSSEADRFVMGLLRACADVILVGSGTLRASPKGTWTPEAIFAEAAPGYAELRRLLGLPPQPAVAVVTAGAGLPVGHPILDRRPIVLTTDTGARRLAPELPSAEVVAVAGGDRVDADAAVDALRARGYARILCEGGPTLLGSLLDAGRVDELFLTLSPLFAGRSAVAGGALSLVEAVELLPDRRVAASVRGVRRHGSHLFLRYALEFDRAARGA